MMFNRPQRQGDPGRVVEHGRLIRCVAHKAHKKHRRSASFEMKLPLGRRVNFTIGKQKHRSTNPPDTATEGGGAATSKRGHVLEMWVVGRKWPDGREVYVCYESSLDQDVSDIAWTLINRRQSYP